MPNEIFAQSFACTGGGQSHPATQAEADAAFPKGSVVVGKTQVCPGQSSGGITEDAGKAKESLNTMWCGGKAAQCGPYKSDVEHLDPQFTVCAAKFLQEVRQKDPSICIASGFRSTEHQQFLCSGGCGRVNGPCAPAGQSKHQSGRAIDIEKPGFNTLPAWVHQTAREGGGVSFPVPGDDGHMEPANTNASDCATPGYIAPGNGGGLTSQSPTSQFASAIRQALGVQQPQLPPQPMLPPQPLAQAQPITNAFMPPMPMINPTVTATSSDGTSDSGGPSTYAPGVSDSITGGIGKTTATGTSLADKLQELAFGVSTGMATASGPYIPLVINPNDRGNAADATTSTTSAQFATSTGAVVTQNTFGQNSVYFTPDYSVFQSATGFGEILARVRVVLSNMLTFLRPFNRQLVSPGVSE